MDMGRFLIETHLRTGRSIKELAAAHDVSARWLFKLLRRYRLAADNDRCPAPVAARRFVTGTHAPAPGDRSARRRHAARDSRGICAALEARLKATQAITLEWVKCRGSPRISQMPLSG